MTRDIEDFEIGLYKEDLSSTKYPNGNERKNPNGETSLETAPESGQTLIQTGEASQIPVLNRVKAERVFCCLSEHPTE